MVGFFEYHPIVIWFQDLFILYVLNSYINITHIYIIWYILVQYIRYPNLMGWSELYVQLTQKRARWSGRLAASPANLCVYTYIYIYVYTCIQISRSLSLSLSLYIYIYIYMYISCWDPLSFSPGRKLPPSLERRAGQVIISQTRRQNRIQTEYRSKYTCSTWHVTLTGYRHSTWHVTT